MIVSYIVLPIRPDGRAARRKFREAAQFQVRMLGAMIIAAGGGEQTMLLGALGIDASLVAAVTAGDHLDTDAPQFAELPNQAAHLEASKAVTGGMGDDRLPTSRQNPAQGLFQASPVAADMARLALHQIVFEDIPDRRGIATLYQEASKMGAADEALVAGKGQGAGIGPLDALGRKAPADLLGPPAPIVAQAQQAGGEVRGHWIDAQAKDVDGPPPPADGDLDPGDQRQPQLLRGGLGLHQAIQGVVIGEGQDPNSNRGGTRHQFRGPKGAVGGGGMGVKVMQAVHQGNVTLTSAASWRKMVCNSQIFTVREPWAPFPFRGQVRYYFSTPMKLLLDFFPILLFFIAYKLAGIYVATGVAIAAAAMQVGWVWWRSRKVEKMHLATLGLLVVFGGMTLALQDPIFVMWKPTLVNWLFALVFLGSHFIGGRTLIERTMSHAIDLPPGIWPRLNLLWVGFFFLSGAANLYVVYDFSGFYSAQQALLAAAGVTEIDLSTCAKQFTDALLAQCQDTQAREEVWVNFKLFGLLGLTIAFIIAQGLYLARHIRPSEEATEA